MNKNLIYLFFLTIGISACTPKVHYTDSIPNTRLDSIALSFYQSAPDTLTLLFVGDIMQHKPQVNAAKQADGSYDYTECFKHLTKEIKAADIAVANLETTLGDNNFTGYPMFCSPKDLASSLKETGFNLILTANNHSLDRFSKGVSNTIQTLDSLNMPYLGTYRNLDERNAGHPYYITHGKHKLAFMNYTYGTNGIKVSPPTIVNLIDTTEIKADLVKANNDRADIKIVCIHWGNEYQTRQNQEQKELGKWLLANGATHVIGSHPHVIQPITVEQDSVTLEKNVIAYSLGNSISNMSKPNTDGGMILKLKIYDDNSFVTTDVSYALAWVNKPYQGLNKNYILYPTSFPADSLPASRKTSFERFKKLSDNIMKHNSKGIEAFFIE